MLFSKARRKPVDYHRILRDVSRDLMRLKKPQRLLGLVTRFIDREIELSHTSILIFDEQKKHFTFIQSKGRTRVPLGLVKIEYEHPLISFFERGHHKPISHGDHLIRSDLRKMFNSKNDFRAQKIHKVMEHLKAELIIPAYDQKNVIALLLLGKKKNAKSFEVSEISFFQALAHACSIALKTAKHHDVLLKKNIELENKIAEIEKWRAKEKDTYQQILKSLAQEVQEKDPYTYGHISQVEKLGIMTAEELGLDLSGNRKDILSASLILHDVGKIGIPDHVLLKPAKLDPDEWTIMKTHVEKGVRILKPLQLFREVAEIIHCHHERCDGKGYPRGLTGDQIPIESKIISVVDAYHAIVSKRCYDAARPISEAFRELKEASGTQFDSVVVEAFIRAQKRMLAKRGIEVSHIQDH